MGRDFCSVEGALNDVIERCMSRMTAPAETAAQTMCAKLLDLSPTVGALMGPTERQTQTESHSNSDDIVIHPQPHG